MPTTKTQTRMSATSSQTIINASMEQTLLTSSISSSGIGTPIDGIELVDRFTSQAGFFIMTQSNNNLIPN